MGLGAERGPERRWWPAPRRGETRPSRECDHVPGIGRAVGSIDNGHRTLTETITELRQRFADIVVMADCGSLPDALAAQEAGADVVGTTLSGYTGEREKTAGPDVELIDQMVAACHVPVIVEGRVHTPAQAADAMRRGAFAVVVGTAITHPTTITGWFHDAVAG